MQQTMRLSKCSGSTASTRRPEPFVPVGRSSLRSRAARAQQQDAIAVQQANRQQAVTSPLRSSVVTRVAAQEASASTSATTKQWYALVANAEFWFNDVQNESLAEQLRERVRFFKETNREVDFWIVPEPKWLDSKYPKEAKMVKRPCVALISTDEVWITFMKLRLDRVLRINLGAVPQDEALAVGGTVPEFKTSPKWTAPYSPYSRGWWEVFVPKQQ